MELNSKKTDRSNKSIAFAAFFVAVLAFTALGTFAVPASALVGPDVRVVSASFDRELTPGAQANLTVVLENVGLFECAYKITTQIQPTSPISIAGFDSQIIGKFCAPDKPSVVFSIKVDPNAPMASYPITLVTTYESDYRAVYATTNTIYAQVQGMPEITAHVTKTNPVSVYPGDDFSIDVTIDNTGSYRADSLTLRLSAENPLEVKTSTETQSAATLQPRSSVTKTFYLHVPENGAAKEYGLTVTASYIDENGVLKTKAIPLTVAISKKALFDALDGVSTAFIDSRNNELRFKLKNTGTDDAKRVRAKLLPAFPFSTQGSVQFIDNMAPGEEKELVFYVDVDKEGVPGEYSLDLSITFENADGEKFSDTIPISAKAAYTPLFNAVFLNYWYAWAAAAAIAAFVLIRRRREAKAKTKAK